VNNLSDRSNTVGFGGNVTVQSNQGAIALKEIETGSILKSAGTTRNGGNVEIRANSDLTVGDITTLAIGMASGVTSTVGNGGTVTVRSQTGNVQTGIISTIATSNGNGNVGSGASINISTDQGAIATGNLESLVFVNKGVGGSAGAITLQGDRIQTGNVNAQAKVASPGLFAGNGGAIKFTATTGDVQTGAIITQSTRVSAGTVTLKALNNVTVQSIDSQGSGGAVNIDAGQFFRALGQFNDRTGAQASIATGGGSIAVKHNGGYVGTPFIVGDASVNGSAATFTTGKYALEFKSYPAAYTQGDLFNKIQLITAEVPVPPPAPTVTNPPPASTPVVPPTTSAPSPLQNLTALDPVTVGGEISADSGFNETFKNYAGQETAGRKVTTEQARNLALQIEQEAGVRPAFLYLNFLPHVVQEQGKFVHKRDRDALEILLITSSGHALRRVRYDLDRASVLKAATVFRSKVTNRRSRDYLESAQQMYQMLIAPIEPELEAQKITNILFMVDSGLRSLPFAAFHNGKQFLVEQYSLGLAPSLGLLSSRYTPIKNATVLAMGASKFSDQLPLPAVPVELEQIMQTPWQGKALLNEQFTLANLEAERPTGGILHLATHGEFKPGAANQSYIQLWDSKLTLDQMRVIGAQQLPDLLVLSACRTALGDEQAELGFAGLATQAGVKSALASLWYISDAGSLAMMTEFYHHLADPTVTTKSEALRRSQLAMLRSQASIQKGILQLPSRPNGIVLPGELASVEELSFAHPYYWAPFTMIGNPW
jgi:CHAT domain-containing protein